MVTLQPNQNLLNSMDKNLILKQEADNDGKSVYLYYDAMVGLYLAYGLSAYYTTMVTEPYISYSEEMEMPVALLRKEHILYLRQSLTKVEHEMKKFYLFKLRGPVGNAGYDKWLQKILDRHKRVVK